MSGRNLGYCVVLAFGLLGGPSAWGTDYYVDPTDKGPFGNGLDTFTTVQAAINGSATGTAANPSRILIYPGTYDEQITVGSNRPYLDLVGLSTNPANIVLTFDLNATSVVNGSAVGTQGSASTTISASNFTAANLTFANSTPQGIAQAVALLSQGDKNAFLNCQFTGFQDTLYAKSGRDYFTNCYVTGTVDYIFGDSTAVFNDCTINTSVGGATITAPNTTPSTAVGYVFLNSKLTTSGGTTNSSVYLSRPWQYTTADSYTVYINTEMGPQIMPVGWSTWDSGNTNPAGDTRYAEYDSMNLSGSPLSVSGRASWSHQLTAAQASEFTLSNIFGPGSTWDSWINNSASGWGTSNYPSVTSYTSWGTGDTWDPTIQLATTGIPEPGTLTLMLVASTGLLRRRARRQ
jgi:pectinesterase